MTATLYVVPGSHPSLAGRLMLERKQLEYRRIDLLPAIHKPLLRALGFPGTTVPALRIDGRRIQSTLKISRALEELRPGFAPLFPSDPAARAEVEEAEAWGEAVLQPVPRRLSWWALARDRSGLRSFAEGARLHVPLGLAIRTAAPIIAVERRINSATDAQVQADMAALAGLLDHARRAARVGRARRPGTECGRLPDRDERSAAAVLRRPPRVDRTSARRCIRKAHLSGLSGAGRVRPPVRLDRAALGHPSPPHPSARRRARGSLLTIRS